MAKIIAIMSPKGGVGKTFIASTLGLCLAKLGYHTLIIDTNVYAANLSIYMGLIHTPTTFNEMIKFNLPPENAIYKFNSSLDILPATTKVEIEDLSFGLKTFRNFLFKISNKYDYIVLDTEPGFTKNNEVIMNSADKTFLVATPDIPTLMTTHKMLLLLRKINAPEVSLVINKALNEYYELKDQEIKEIMGINISAKIPFDKRVIRAVSLRTPLEKGRTFNIILNLAKEITGKKGETKKGILSLFKK